jgi:hypothetical protein
MTADRQQFRIEASLRAYEGDAEVFSRDWDLNIPRDML